MEPSKGLSTGVDEAGILLFNIQYLIIEGYYLHAKVDFLYKTLNFFLLIPIMASPSLIYAFSMVSLLEILLWTGHILEFKRGFLHLQKGHPTLVTQVDLILEKDE